MKDFKLDDYFINPNELADIFKSIHNLLNQTNILVKSK